jgi:hypothetical protein
MSGRFAQLERRMRLLVASLQPPMNDLQVKEVLHFVDAGEYGVALEWLGDLLREEGLLPSAEAVVEMRRLADEMEIDTSEWRFAP